MALFNPSASPAVVIREVDLTGGVPNVQSSTGVFVGNFNWGPVKQRTLVSSEATLASTFTNPSKTNARDFISAAMFLSYSQSLYVTRMVDAGALNAQPKINTLSFTNVDYTYGGSGVDAEFNVSINELGKYVVQLTNAGTAYVNDETITILGSNVGGVDVKNDITLTITSVDTGGEILEFVTSGDSTLEVKVFNEDDFQFQIGSLGERDFIAKFPGKLGNALKVEVCPKDAFYDAVNDKYWDYASYFTSAPAEGEVHVVVLDEGYSYVEDGDTIEVSFAGGNSSTPVVLEVYPFVSLNPTATTDTGISNYIQDVINRKSQFVYQTAKLTTPTTLVSYDFDHGVDSGILSEDEYLTGFSLYEDIDVVTLDFLIAPSMSTREAQTTVVNNLVTVANSLRKDCVVITSPSLSDFEKFDTTEITKNIVDTAGTFTKSTYLIIDGNLLKVYDKYNDQYIEVPAASSTAGLMAATDLNVAPWFSPAGTRRGNYFGITSIKFSPSKAQRDALYNANVNPIANIPGQGVILYGDKTNSSRPSAFDRINVRRLFLVLERAIGAAAKNVIFELNDEFTRAEFVGIVEPLLREVQGRRGITDFRVICDETNNTPAVIDRNEFIANIFIKPTRSINYITLNFVAVRTGVTFEEVVGAV